MGDIDDFYMRKLSRSPEKSEYYQLSEADRRLICELRSVMHGVHRKIKGLRSEADDKDLSSDQYRYEHDVAKPDHMVDMYGNSSVNEELRQRLSFDRKLNNEKSALWAKDDSEDHFYSHKDRKRSWDLDDFDSLSKLRTRRHAKRRARLVSRRQSFSASELESEDEVMFRKRKTQLFQLDSPSENGINFFPADEAPVETIADVPHAFTTDDAALDRSRSIPMLPLNSSNHLDQLVMEQDVSVSEKDKNIFLTRDMNQEPESSSTVKVHSDDLKTVDVRHGSDLSEQNSASHPYKLSKKSTDDTGKAASLFLNATFTGSLSKQLSSQIAKLFHELEDAKDVNIQVHDKLLAADAELELIKHVCRCGNIPEENMHDAGVAAAMVLEMSQAGQEREQELVSGLRNVRNERDDLLQQLERLKHQSDKQQSNSQQLFKESFKTDASAIDDHHCKNCSKLEGENQSILKDRDAAHNKRLHAQEEVVRLEKDLLVMEEKLRIFERRQVLAEDERDFSLAKVEDLEEELQMLRLSSSLQNSLSHASALRDEIVIARAQHEDQKHQLTAQINAFHDEKVQLATAVDELTETNSHLQDELTVNQKALNQFRDDNSRLERLVNVLRRKVGILSEKVEPF